jgi:hypothetical protein
MSTPVLSPLPGLPDDAAESFIERQLAQTRQQVRLHDCGVVLAGWLAGLLGGLLLLIACDHWLLPLGTAGRWFAWSVLVAASALYFWQALWPLLWQRINPNYAAKVIEDAQPGLKNSLLNFLLLRRAPEAASPVVVEALRRRAAYDLTHLSLEHVLDITPLIRLGYVLCGLLVVLGVYKVVSPKDPFASAARVLVPWSSIARPTRVALVSLTPGDVTLVQGESLTVTVEVAGLGNQEAVTLFTTTADQQVVEQPHPMQRTSPRTFVVTLPQTGGLQQSLVYRVHAGDQVSPTHRVTVLPTPRLVVEQIELTAPAYTRKPVEVLRAQGDFKALAGSRVNLVAKANFPINNATLEMNPLVELGAGRRAETLPMQVEGDTARCSWVVSRLASGQPSLTSYRLLFVAENGRTNPEPVVHSVEIVDDLPPEIEMLHPTVRQVELPLDRTLTLELRARDPDFGLTSLALESERSGRPLPSTVLLEHKSGVVGPVNKKHQLNPRSLGCAVGDELLLRGVALDNHHNAAGTFAPQLQRTAPYRVVITAPQATTPPASKNDPNQQSSKDPNAQAPQNSNSPNASVPDNEKPASGGKESASAPEEGKSSQNTPPSEKGKPKENTEGSGKNSPPPADASGSGQAEKGEQGEQGEPGQQGGQGSAGEASQKPMSGSENGETGSSGAGSSGGDQQGESSGTSQGAGETGNASPNRENGNAKSQGNSAGGDKTNGGPNDPSSEQPSPGNSNQSPADGSGQSPGEPLHDGEVIEETLRRLAEKQGASPEGQSASGAQDSSSSPQNSASPMSPQGAKEAQGAIGSGIGEI